MVHQSASVFMDLIDSLSQNESNFMKFPKYLSNTQVWLLMISVSVSKLSAFINLMTDYDRLHLRSIILNINGILLTVQ